MVCAESVRVGAVHANIYTTAWDTLASRVTGNQRKYFSKIN